MTVNDAIKNIENLVDSFSEYPNWYIITRNDIEAIVTLAEFAKEQFNIE